MQTNQPLTEAQKKAYVVAKTRTAVANLTPKAIDYKRLVAIQAMAAKQLDQAMVSVAEYEKELRAEVKYFRVGATVTLQYDGRVIKLVKNSHNRYNIKENGKLIRQDCLESINEIRFLFALGKI